MCPFLFISDSQSACDSYHSIFLTFFVISSANVVLLTGRKSILLKVLIYNSVLPFVWAIKYKVSDLFIPALFFFVVEVLVVYPHLHQICFHCSMAFERVTPSPWKKYSKQSVLILHCVWSQLFGTFSFSPISVAKRSIEWYALYFTASHLETLVFYHWSTEILSLLNDWYGIILLPGLIVGGWPEVWSIKVLNRSCPPVLIIIVHTTELIMNVLVAVNRNTYYNRP